MKNCILRYICFVVSIATIDFLTALDFNKVVIWGHKLHYHTHSYIHFAFYRAFKHLGYQTYWFDNDDNVEAFDFSHTLFLTEGQVDQNIPLREDCYYIVHNCSDLERYKELIDKKRVIHLYQYHDKFDSYPQKIAPLTYGNFEEASIAIPWATDLLPHEIEQNKKKIKKIRKKKIIYWVGTVGAGWAGNINELEPFMRACKKRKIEFKQMVNVDPQESRRLIQQSFMAPAIVGTWQEQHGYVPCRVFKNISYGKMVATNSQKAHELFENKLIYNSNTYKLFFDAQKRLRRMKPRELHELMDIVKEKHTYINRIKTLLDFFDAYITADIEG